jgi:hypothetical protein
MLSMSQGLRRLSKRAEEAPSHSFTVTKPACVGDLLDREAPLLKHQPSGFQSKLFDCPGGRAPCFDSKDSTELARAQPSYLCQPLDREVFPEVLSRECERLQHPIGLRIQFKHGGVLRLTSTPPMVHDQRLGCLLCKFGTRISFNESKSKVYPSRHSRRCPKRPVGYE